MKKSQLVNMVIRPTLKEIPHGYSEPALLAITMIIAHESKRGEYIHQLGNGPALGVIQMEPSTHESTWTYGDSIWGNAFKLGIIASESPTRPPVERLLYDLRYNVFMARQRLFMKPELLPNLADEFAQIDAMSKYLKKHWNSVKGAASDTSYADDYWEWED